MSDQSDALNKFAREKMGAKADAAAGASHLTVLGDQDDGAKKPQMHWVRLPADGHQLSAFAREVGGILRQNGVFRRDRAPVTINHDKGEMLDMSPERFRTYVEAHMVTYKWRKVGPDGDIKVPCTMGVEMARGALQSDVFIDQQRELDRVNHVRMPVMRKDGSIELLPEGYDQETRTFTMPNSVEIDETMDFQRAKAVLDDLLSEFPWGDWAETDGVKVSRSKAVVLASMLTMYGLGLQRLDADRMNFLFSSNSPRSGKSLLAKIALTPVFGPAEGKGRPDKEEMRKMLDACALSAKPYVFLDNLKGNLDDAQLEAFMTTSVWSGRYMGTQKTFSAPRTAVVFITGNSLSVSTDLAGRTLVAELYVEEGDPQARVVRRVIDNAWLSRAEVRRDILSALWSVVRHWFKAGAPGCSRTIRGYEEWSRIFGGMVEWAGWGNPLIPPKIEHAGDTEWADMQEMVEGLVTEMGAAKVKEFDFAELIDCCRTLECFAWLIDGRENKDGEFEPSAKCRSTLGKLWSAKYGGRTFSVDGKRVRFGVRGRNRSRKYRVEVGV